jgi:2-polyprenyl-3-methyl-5-hydroxy-6-metoxy-1,4-benzoquinol methylase
MLDATEEKALIACRKLHKDKQASFKVEAIAERAENVFGEKVDGLEASIAALAFRGYLKHDVNKDAYSLSDAALEIAARLDRENEQKGFGEWMRKSQESATYAEFCRRVYGTSFIQFNMVDAEQIETLLGALALKPGDRVLDLGCGIGTQAEYIADRTGAHVTGLDFAPVSIELARARTEAKADRLDFVLGDLDAIKLPRSSFDVALAFDTLYFVEELDSTIAQIAALLVPGGHMALFYSQVKSQDSPPDILAAEGTRLAQALKKLALGFETIEFTANERRIWERSLEEATALKASFEAEGNLELWKGRDAETRELLELCRAGADSRFLYLVRT